MASVLRILLFGSRLVIWKPMYQRPTAMKKIHLNPNDHGILSQGAIYTLAAGNPLGWVWFPTTSDEPSSAPAESTDAASARNSPRTTGVSEHKQGTPPSKPDFATAERESQNGGRPAFSPERATDSDPAQGTSKPEYGQHESKTIGQSSATEGVFTIELMLPFGLPFFQDRPEKVEPTKPYQADVTQHEVVKKDNPKGEGEDIGNPEDVEGSINPPFLPPHQVDQEKNDAMEEGRDDDAKTRDLEDAKEGDDDADPDEDDAEEEPDAVDKDKDGQKKDDARKNDDNEHDNDNPQTNVGPNKGKDKHPHQRDSNNSFITRFLKEVHSFISLFGEWLEQNFNK